MTSLLPAALAVALLAQAMTAAKPDFSGTWTMDRERSESALQEQPIGTGHAVGQAHRHEPHHRDNA